MTVQFRLGHNDHKKVEDFLSSAPSATSAITLDPKAFRHQRHAADIARDLGVSVHLEVGTERLAYPGFGLQGYPMWAGAPYVVDSLAADPRLRVQIVGRTLQAHPEFATHVTAPHFYVDNERAARLNVDLAEMTQLELGEGSSEMSTRAVLTVSNRYAKKHALELAAEYARAGIVQVELRLTPFGGEDESLAKIRDGFAVAQAFTDAGLRVTLGQSGNLGPVAVALGHAESYSVGIGLWERVNHTNTVNRQKQEPKPRTEENPGGGPMAGVFLNGVAMTAHPKLAEALLSHSDLRTRIGCREGKCGHSVRGPLLDVRDHYLHSRDLHMARLLAQPRGWRATSEIERLRAALAMRETINSRYIGRDGLKGVSELRTRTLTNLIQDIEAAQAS